MHDPGGPYKFPKPEGDTESNRLDVQHHAWTALFEGLYPEEIKENVEGLMERSDNPEVLDIGCGSGIWSIQMARLFPQAQVMGLDITPPAERQFPSNFSFRAYNLADGVPPEYKSKFDIIHCRTVCQHVPDPQGLIDSLSLCLKPDGLLLIGDIDFRGYNESTTPLKPFTHNPSLSISQNLKNPENASWHGGWFHYLNSVLCSPGYEPPSVLVKNSKLLKEVMGKEMWVPIGWEGRGDKREEKAGEFMIQSVTRVYKFSHGPLAKLLDIPEEIKDALRVRGLSEMRTTRTHVLYRYSVGTVGQETEQSRL